MDYRIIELGELAGVDDPRRWAVEAHNQLWHDELVRQHGDDDLAWPLSVELANSLAQPERRMHLWVALPAHATEDAEAVLGAAKLHLPQLDNLQFSEGTVIVRPEARGRGIGTALGKAMLDRCRADGRRVLASWAGNIPAVPASHPDALEVGHGRGWIDGSHPAARFALGLGLRPEQVELHSVLRLPVELETLQRLHDDALAYADDYDLVTWEDSCPDQHIDGFAELNVAMSTDIPHADLDLEPQAVDAARIRRLEARRAAAGVRSLTTAARHLPSGRLVGYTTLLQNAGRPGAAHQEDTLVLRDHRGHRLGMLLKVWNLRRAQQMWPSVERVHTWNAEENNPMLSINFAIGFAVESIESAWQARLEG
ncbi:MAG TPA: GNAT family N-acetyltransferase [Propionibacteriaceae bacterium]|nr:GNAT family N-acetyltransferase [Propionibacteriaceae bacterium]